MERIIPPVLVLFLGIPLALLWAFHPDTFPMRPHRSMPWDIPLVAGIGLLVWARLWFARRDAEIHTFRTPRSLETGGPFRFSRNPMYLGLLLVLLGGAFYVNTWCALIVPAVFLLVANQWYIPFEERALKEEFDTRYDIYAGKVRRWI